MMTAADLGCDSRHVSPPVLDIRCIMDVTHKFSQLGNDRGDSATTSFAFDHVSPGRASGSTCATEPGPSGSDAKSVPQSDGSRFPLALPRCVKKSVSSTRLVSISKASPLEVFDGHGGIGAASYVQAHILQHLADGLSGAPNMTLAFQAAYDLTDREFEIACAADKDLNSGTTAITMLITGRCLVVANAGDCRAVLCRSGRAVDLSEDHTTKSASERVRILAAGGMVDSENYLNGQLGVARAIGDFHHEGLKTRGDPNRPSGPLICDPEVRERLLEEEDEFLILGCDGLWDVFTSADAVKFARTRLQSHNDPQRCSQELVAEALHRNTSDNLTVITVCLRAEKPKQLESRWRPKRCVSVDGLCTLQQSLMG